MVQIKWGHLKFGLCTVKKSKGEFFSSPLDFFYRNNSYAVYCHSRNRQFWNFLDYNQESYNFKKVTHLHLDKIDQ